MTQPPVIVLHVGTMKSGTTYLQSRLEHHRSALGADGILFPGPQWKDQLRAVGDALERTRSSEDLAVGSGRWAGMRAQMLDWTGSRVVLSVEHLCRASRAQARAIVASLAPAVVEVVVTARDLGRDIPSTWQQEVKAGAPGSFDAFLQALSQSALSQSAVDRADPSRDDRAGGGTRAPAGQRPPGTAPDPLVVLARRFWRRHDPAALTQRWAGAVTVDHITVVTVPPSGTAPDTLWQRFALAAGLDADRYPAAGDDLPLNPSLGVAGVELVRRLNERLGDRVAQGPHRDLVKFTVANSTLAGQALDPPLRVPTSHRGWVAERAGTIVTGLRSAGVRVVGDLGDLIPAPPAASSDPGTAIDTTDSTPAIPAHAMAEATVRATAALLRKASADRSQKARGDGGAKGRRRSVIAEHESAAQRRAARDHAGSQEVEKL